MAVKEKIKNLPVISGVYFFRDKARKIIYIGKANNLKRRVSSYFQKRGHDVRISNMVSRVADVEYLPTASSAEALIYESSLIKLHKPKYNIALKDDKSYPRLKLTVKEKYPKLCITREKINDGSKYYGPYTNARLLREALVFMKRVFPLRTCNVLPKKPCLNYHIGQCLGPCLGPANDNSYKEVVSDVKLFLSGKKKALIRRLSARMTACAQEQEYEKAMKIKKQLEALSIVIDQRSHSFPLDDELRRLKDELNMNTVPATIEAFDISNIQGSGAVGSMVTFFNAKPLKSAYRRYRIKTVKKIDDYLMIQEIVRRRYGRLVAEGKKLPDLIIIDGGLGHLNAALKEIKTLGVTIPVISIAKKKEEIFIPGKKKPLQLSERNDALKLIQRIRDEAHRFAITYHKFIRKKEMFK